MELHFTGIPAIIVLFFIILGISTMLFAAFIYIILYLNRADRRKNGCDYVKEKPKNENGK